LQTNINVGLVVVLNNQVRKQWDDNTVEKILVVQALCIGVLKHDSESLWPSEVGR